jgi:hypothetical protein
MPCPSQISAPAMGAITLPAVLATFMAFTSDLCAADRLRPTFTSEVVSPQADTVLRLLRTVCGEGVRTVNSGGRNAFGCGDGSMAEIVAGRNRQRRYPWMPYTLWEADGIIFGHFLSPTSEDVASIVLRAKATRIFGDSVADPAIR